jgi:nucleoside-diphosphate-sugar epimerase
VRVFLTGGTGLIGSHVAERVRNEGHEVVALVRHGSESGHLRAIGCRVATGELRDGTGRLAATMAGCTHVVHAAALVYSGAPWAEIEAVNVGGTGAVMKAASDVGAGVAVHVSSVAVYGEARPGLDDSTPEVELPPVASKYALSKRQAETAARSEAVAGGLRLTILRPASVYGERDRLMTPRIARLTRWPVAPTLGSGNNTIPAVYAGNVADAVWLALVAGHEAATWDVALDHPLTQRMLLEGVARGMGRRPLLLPVPASAVRAAATVLGWLGAPTPGASDLPLGRVVALSLADNPYSSRRIRDELGWRPPYRHEEALPRAGAWLAMERRRGHR